MEDQIEKLNLVIQGMQQRMGEMVTTYETQIAFLRAELTVKAQQNNDATVQKENK